VLAGGQVSSNTRRRPRELTALPRSVLLFIGAALLLAAPVGSQAGAFFFIQLSDPQFGMYTADRDFAQETANFEFAVASVNRLRPAFVVITGDLVNKPGDAAQIAEYERVKARVRADIPVYDMPGNHDVENAPTPASVAMYRARGGRDRYTFRHGGFTGIVLNSSLIHTPDKARDEVAAQDAWLRNELATARAGGARHVVIFQHHPWFLARADEPDEYFNIPIARRAPLLQLFRESGVRYLVSGHYHRNAHATDVGLESIVTGPVGRPLGDARSGLRVFVVTSAAIVHRFYEFGSLPNAIEPASGKVE
jgi:3',5'-cyclic AMP phosphodiesterase CpdA